MHALKSDDFGNNELVKIRGEISNKDAELSQLRDELANTKKENEELRNLLRMGTSVTALGADT
jgi:predicted RNase H-like nuclease (RuvC/YqgF family)